MDRKKKKKRELYHESKGIEYHHRKSLRWKKMEDYRKGMYICTITTKTNESGDKREKKS